MRASSPVNVADSLLRSNLGERSSKIAYICGEDTLTYGDLARDAGRFANLLRSIGVRPGDRVVIALPDGLAAVKVFMGTMLLAAAPTPVNDELTPGEYAFLISDSGAAAVIALEGSSAVEAAAGFPGVLTVLCDQLGPRTLCEHSAEFEAVAPPSDAPGILLYTSGSTGVPKGVPHGQEALIMTSMGLRSLGIGPSDVNFCVNKLHFVFGVAVSLGVNMMAGAAAVLYPGKLDAADLLAEIARARPSVLYCVPSLYNLMLRTALSGASGVDLSSLRLSFSAGEGLPLPLARAWMDLTGKEMLSGYGSTEIFNAAFCGRPGQERPLSSGLAYPGYEMKLVGEDGIPVGDGLPGLLFLRGPNLCAGYWNRPEDSREKMPGEGWLATGDIFVKEDGWYTHQGRADDMLKAGGKWVSPAQVEDALRTHPTVLECGVAGRSVGGLARPCAFVVPRPEALSKTRRELTADIMRFARDNLPPSMRPVSVHVVDALPKTSTGKVRRSSLCQLLEDGGNNESQC